MTTYSIPPTVLYIKQHSITGLKYFGKTTKDPLKYKGSGTDWKLHLKEYGSEHIITIWVSELYTDKDAIMEAALTFSRDNNIVESELWANQKIENGLDGGGTKGIPCSDKTKKKIRDTKTGKTQSPEHRKKNSDAHIGMTSPLKGKLSPKKGKPGKPHSTETKQKLHDINIGIPKRKVECPHCGKVGGLPAMKRYHFDRCKKKPQQ